MPLELVFFAYCGTCLFQILSATHQASAADRGIDFTGDIRPILAGRCYKCHGPDPNTREAGLRLDVADGATRPLESGFKAIVPGDADASELLKRITSPDPDVRMPPQGQGDPLSAQQATLLRDWITQGARYAVHWSFTPPVRADISKSRVDNWCHNPIDRFTLQKMKEQDLTPAPAADRYTLSRRLSLDLTGLPPSIELVDMFVADPSPAAVEALVDRLLESPAFGERWGRIWLDLARYADSAGYADDPLRTIWMYRDWVIQSINDNLPFDQFTTEQLAGDLLENPTQAQLIATAFHRNTLTNSEGGTDDEEFRTVAIVDRVNTTMQVWMGLTMACAQCHTHKYDPITQEEFFQVYAILNQTEDADRRDETPTLDLFTQAQHLQRTRLMEQIDRLEKELGQLQAVDAGKTAANPPQGKLLTRFVRVELPGRDKYLSLAEVQVFAGDENAALKGTAKQNSTAYEGDAQRAIDGNPDGHYTNGNSVTHTDLSENAWWEVDLGRAVNVDRVVIWNRTDTEGIWTRLDDCRIVLLDDTYHPLAAAHLKTAPLRDVTLQVPKTFEEFAEKKAEASSQFQMSRTSASPEQDKLKQAIDAAKKELGSINSIPTPIMRELPVDKHRKTHIQIRGNFLDLGSEVQPGVPAAFSEHISFSKNVQSRLDLARWLLDRGNPLTARVVANRTWEALFGTGLVETSEDFGMQGELPTHPELLDWLAVELIEPGWDMKHLIRTIVLSATYQQESNTSADQEARDPNNRWLARGPRFRLPAETVRDQALALGGILSDKMYGPPVNPPRPKLGLTAAFGRSTDWETSAGEDRHRRGLYTLWQRSMPYPSMDAFDAPSREVCTIRRSRTNTPLQALVTLNDPVYIEAAQGLAGRMLTEASGNDRDRLAYGFRLCVARIPMDSELAVLAGVLNESRQRFARQTSAARELPAISTGDMGHFAAAEQAAWTIVANVLLNLDETLARR